MRKLYLWIVPITFLMASFTYGMPGNSRNGPISTIIQESKVLRHFPSLSIVTFKYEREDHSYYFRTIVTDLDDPNGVMLYDTYTHDWYDCQMEHYYATQWAIETFPADEPIPAVNS